MIALFLIVLLMWGAVDWFLAATRDGWLWILAPFAFAAILFGIMPLVVPALSVVLDEPLPRQGRVTWHPIIIAIAAFGMIMQALPFWRQLGDKIWRRFN